jgi:hypothetical protein
MEGVEIMRIHITLQRALAFLVLVLSFFPSALSQTTPRNLRDYKQGVYLDLKDEFIDANKTNRQIAPARQFLWDLWRSHTKGYLRRRSYSIEGNPGWCTFFIEPDSTGKWRVTLECKASICPFTSKEECQKYLRTVATETYDSVERIETGYDVFSNSPRRVSDDENRNPLEFVLIFRNSQTGKTAQL